MSAESARSTRSRTWHEEHRESLTRGQRAADWLRNFMGSWGFVAGFVAFMLIWAAINSATLFGWDPYPYILLNLFLSMLAGLQGAILLIAAKRQDSIAAALAQHDYETDRAAKADIEGLLALSERQLVIMAELQEVLRRLDSVQGAPRRGPSDTLVGSAAASDAEVVPPPEVSPR